MHVWWEHVDTFVMLTAGNEIPTKKPKTTPTIVTTISLMLSLGFLIALQVGEHPIDEIEREQQSENNEEGQCANLRATTGSLAIARYIYSSKSRQRWSLASSGYYALLNGSMTMVAGSWIRRPPGLEDRYNRQRQRSKIT
jgi:hypothetical protein